LPSVGFGTRADELIAPQKACCFALADLVPLIFGCKIDDRTGSPSLSAGRSRI
jgi:hypothetical protein